MLSQIAEEILWEFVRQKYERGLYMYLKDKSQILTLRIDVGLMNWLDKESDRLGVSVSNLIRMILNSYCKGVVHENVKRD